MSHENSRPRDSTQTTVSEISIDTESYLARSASHSSSRSRLTPRQPTTQLEASPGSGASPTASTISAQSIHPSQAHRGVRIASASSHHILTLEDDRRILTPVGMPDHSFGSQLESPTHLAAALARLPWADPPRHTPSPNRSSGGTQLDVDIRSSPATLQLPIESPRTTTPTYPFLTHDPVSSPYAHSRRSSRASTSSVSSHSRSTRSGLSAFGGGGPSVLVQQSEEDLPRPTYARFSGISSTPSIISPLGSAIPTETTWLARSEGLFFGQRPVSAYSGMADVGAPSPRISIGQSSGSGSGAKGERLSIPQSLFDAVRTMSRASKRSKGSHHSIKSVRSKSVKSSKSSVSRPGPKPWDTDHSERLLSPEPAEDVKMSEEMMDLLALVGRAAVLEKILLKGKRVSNATLHSSPGLIRRLTSKSSKPSRPPRSKSSSRASRYSSRAGTPRTSLSLRQRFSRRLKRNQSKEDVFTELGSDENVRDMDDPTLFPPQNAEGEVLVFPEDAPPVPPKERRSILMRNGHRARKSVRLSVDDVKYGVGLIPVTCTTVVCVSPSLSTLPRSSNATDLEKGEPIETPEPWTQSPHLGHRSPEWRKRQSVLTYISTGLWNGRARSWYIAVGIGAGLLVIVILGLLVGLLTRN